MTTKSAPWKTTLTGLSLILCGCLLLSPRPAKAFETEIKGFREFKWGDPPSSAMGKDCKPGATFYTVCSVRGAKYMRGSCNEVDQTNMALPTIGGETPAYISYQFSENKLNDVLIMFADTNKMKQIILDILQEKYGPPNSYSGLKQRDECYWTDVKSEEREKKLSDSRTCCWKFGSSSIELNFEKLLAGDDLGVGFTRLIIKNDNLLNQATQNAEKTYKEKIKQSTNDL